MIEPDKYPTVAFEDSQGPLFLRAGVSPCQHDLQHNLDISHLPLTPRQTNTLVMKRHAPATRSPGTMDRISAFVSDKSVSHYGRPTRKGSKNVFRYRLTTSATTTVLKNSEAQQKVASSPWLTY